MPTDSKDFIHRIHYRGIAQLWYFFLFLWTVTKKTSFIIGYQESQFNPHSQSSDNKNFFISSCGDACWFNLLILLSEYSCLQPFYNLYNNLIGLISRNISSLIYPFVFIDNHLYCSTCYYYVLPRNVTTIY